MKGAAIIHVVLVWVLAATLLTREDPNELQQHTEDLLQECERDAEELAAALRTTREKSCDCGVLPYW